MRRTTSLTAAVLAGLAPALTLLPSATAAGETCRGETATIVGAPGGHVVGTPGDDVIVSRVASTVAAGEGDDLICLSPAEGGFRHYEVQVDAGAGDDVVISEGRHNNSRTDLGPGRDEFHGGGGGDDVEASLDDVVVADRGGDAVTYTIERGEGLPVVVGMLRARRNAGMLEVRAPGRRLEVDAPSGTIRLSGRVVTTFDTSPQVLSGVAQSVRLVGTPGADVLVTAACGRSVLVGRGGDDEFLALVDPATRGRACPRRRMRASGGGGDDVIRGTLHADDLRGGRGDDLIIGNRGRDVANGGPGRDWCRRTAIETSCER